jgi:predicted small lipoprotein YifL
MKNLFLLLIFITFSGCGPVYYVPNTQNVPVMKDKGQTNLSLALNGSLSKNLSLLPIMD